MSLEQRRLNWIRVAVIRGVMLWVLPVGIVLILTNTMLTTLAGWVPLAAILLGLYIAVSTVTRYRVRERDGFRIIPPDAVPTVDLQANRRR